MCNNHTEKTIKKYRIATDILEAFWEPYKKHPERKLYLESKHYEAVHKIMACRTQKLGYRMYGCESCGQVHYVYCSCKHRFCPTCGISATNEWAEKILHNVLNIKHHHVVITLPAALRSLAKRNSVLFYNLMFDVSSDVLKSWFKMKHNIEAGIISVLHTSGADLKYHPHLHIIITGGGLNLENKEIKLLEGDYLMNCKGLKKRFRWAFQQKLIKAYREGLLKVAQTIKNEIDFLVYIKDLNKQDWVISIQNALKDAENIVRYVGRYTKRACISEYKITNIEGEYISFYYNDYKNTPRGEKPKIAHIKLHYVAFLDRLLLHVPQKRFIAVRYYGIYAPQNWKNLPIEYKVNKAAISIKQEHLLDQGEDYREYREATIKRTGIDPLICVECQKMMVLLYEQLPTARQKGSYSRYRNLKITHKIDYADTG